MANEENKSKFSNMWAKASDLGKKAADGIQKGVKELSEKAKDEITEQKIKKYNPLFEEEYSNDGFALAKIIKIISDIELQEIDVCDGAIGWRDRSGLMEILYLSYSFVKSSGIEFFPSASINDIYCVDPTEDKRYIEVDAIFGKAHEERLAELEHIAYMLGAKSCSVELVEGEVSENKDNKSLGTVGISAKISTQSEKSNSKSGKTVAKFSGSDEPRQPILKWFKNDKNILALIDMRCSDKNAITSRSLTLSGSSSATMSKNVAISIDQIISANATVLNKKNNNNTKANNNTSTNLSASLGNKASKEHSSKLIFEVEF